MKEGTDFQQTLDEQVFKDDAPPCVSTGECEGSLRKAALTWIAGDASCSWLSFGPCQRHSKTFYLDNCFAFNPFNLFVINAHPFKYNGSFKRSFRAGHFVSGRGSRPSCEP